MKSNIDALWTSTRTTAIIASVNWAAQSNGVCAGRESWRLWVVGRSPDWRAAARTWAAAVPQDRLAVVGAKLVDQLQLERAYPCSARAPV